MTTKKQLREKLRKIFWYNFQDGCTAEDIDDAISETEVLIDQYADERVQDAWNEGYDAGLTHPGEEIKMRDGI